MLELLIALLLLFALYRAPPIAHCGDGLPDMAETISTATQAPSEHGGGFPPFQQDTFASQLLWLALFFAALYFLASKLALPRLGSILAERRSRIAGDFAAAARMKEEADAAIAAYEKALADARAEAQAMAAEARAKLNRQAEAQRHALDRSLNARLAAADQAIAAAKAGAMANVQAIAADTAIAIVARLIGITPSSDAAVAAVAATGLPVQDSPALRLSASPPRPQTGERGKWAGRKRKGKRP